MFQLIESAINKANNIDTKLNEKALKLEGYSSTKNRILLNNLTAFEGCKYLEIGTWKGSTFYSALYGNSIKYAAAIDNWSLFGGPKNEFFNNLADIQIPFDFFDEDCFKINKNKFKDKFNVYFYDGEHDELDQEMALTYYIDCMEQEFIYICDDYCFEKVKNGTRKGLEKINCKIEKEWILESFHNDGNNWWNGIYIAHIKK